MTTQSHLSRFCDNFLRVKDVPDPWCENGLQVPGKKEVQKIALGTSASRHFLEKANQWGADAVIVHHGLFWRKGVRTLSPLLAERLRILMKNDISLFGYHLPLDAHAEVGNNAQIAKKLGLQNIEMVDICAAGDMPSEIPFEDFTKQCENMFEQKLNFADAFTSETVKRVGICSGGGADYAEICKKAGCDTFITGEISEHHYHDFAEMPMNIAVCGHHATERFGVKALGEILKKEFPEVEILFFKQECPV